MDKLEDWPPKFTVTPERAAGLFLVTHPHSNMLARNALIELLKIYYDKGVEDGRAQED